MDVAVLGDRNLINKIAVNILNFKRFATDIQRM
jgi:hypothetical protein